MGGPDEEDHPDEDVGDDPRRQRVAMHGDSTIPEQRHQRPGKGPRDCGQMDQRGQCTVSPVSRMLVDQVGHQDNLGPPEVAPSPEENPSEDEQVVENKMRTHVGGRRHDRGIFMEKMVDIT